MRQKIAYVHLAYGLDASNHRQRYRDGLVPDETPYGFHHATKMGWEIVFSTDHSTSYLGDLIRRSLIKVLGFDLIHAYRNRRSIQMADVVWTMEEVQYLAICALPVLLPRMKQPRLIAQTVWLFNRWSSYSAFRRFILRFLLRRADVLTVHSSRYLEIIPKCLPGRTGQLLYFGISLESFPPTRREASLHQPVRVASLGGDPTREWSTMLEAFGNNDSFDVKIACTWLTDEEVSSYCNIEAVRCSSMDDFRRLYEWADVIVIGLLPNLYSGITVALEATSLGIPIVSSETGGVPTYFSDDEVLYVPPLDPHALRKAVLSRAALDWSGFATKAQTRFQKEDYSTRGMAARYVALSESLM